MLSPQVIEVLRAIEAVTPDPFIADLDEETDMIPTIHIEMARERVRSRIAEGRQRRAAAACPPPAAAPAAIHADQRHRVAASLLRHRRVDRIPQGGPGCSDD